MTKQLHGSAINLFYPLSEASSYPDSSFVDMVLCINQADDLARRKIRMWLRTEADECQIEINTRRFSAVGKSKDGMWLDFGTFAEDPDELGIPRFGIIRFYGLTVEHALRSCCVLTSQTDVELEGGVEHAENALQGICRKDAGSTTLSPSRAEVGASGTFIMTYTAGTRQLKAGTLLRLTFAKALSKPQTQDKTADGWLTSLDGDAVEFLSMDTPAESHTQTDVLYRLKADLAPGKSLRFEYRTSFIYLFPKIWKTMERRYWWSHLPVMAPAIAVDGRKVFVPPLEANGHSLEVEPGPAERLFLFLPGRIKAKSKVKLVGLFTDHYRNIPARSLLPFEFDLILECDGKRTPLSAKKSFTHWYRFEIALSGLKSGVYRVSAINRNDGKTIAKSNPLQILNDDSEISPIYWGEIHCHSDQSDGSGDYHNIFVHAGECGTLDFAAAADHACYHTDNEWQWMQDVVNAFNKDHEFVTLPGYEWAGQQGHRNVYTSGDRLDRFRGMTPGEKTLDVVYDHFTGNDDVAAGPHVHHTRDFFDCHNPDVQRFMELYSMWGNYEELAFDILNKGAKIGFTGGGDCHEGRCGFSVEDPDGQGKTPHTFSPNMKYRCGLTAALLPGLTRTELVQALRNRRTYATTGARILLDFRMSGTLMGDELLGETNPDIVADVRACAPVASVDIIKNGGVVHSVHNLPEDCSIAWRDTSGEPGWYMLRVTQSDHQKAWSSPIWVR